MNKNVRTLVIDKTDVIKSSENKKLPELSQIDLRQKSYESFAVSDLVVGITESGQTVILKNRWGQDGIVVSIRDYNKYVKPHYENSKPDSGTKKKSFLGRLFSFGFWPFH